jgi:hypothetical protein
VAGEVERGDRPVEVPVEVFNGEETGGRWSGCRGRRGGGEGWGTEEGKEMPDMAKSRKVSGVRFHSRNLLWSHGVAKRRPTRDRRYTIERLRH